MYKVKYYNRDKFIGEELFSCLDKAEDSLLESPYLLQSDYYEIIDRSTDKIVQEFMIPTFDLSPHERSSPHSYQEERSLDWLDWPDDDL